MIGVIDDDAATRGAIERLLECNGFASEAYESAEAFCASGRQKDMRCLILDVRMPGMTGLELQDRLLKTGLRVPIIFVTGYIDDPIRESFKKEGTVAVLEKPFTEEALISQVKAALV